jgi:hypothetical protein
MPAQPPAKPPVIVFARKPAKRAKPVQAAVATTVTRIVCAPKQKQRVAWKRFMALTGRDE